MKLEVGKKYRMRGYGLNYEYVLIVCRENDIIPNVQDNLFAGVIVYKDELGNLTRQPDFCTWREDGAWDGYFPLDSNAIYREVDEQSSTEER